MIITKSNQRSVNNVFDEIFNAFPAQWGGDFKRELSVPVNIHESKDGYHLELSVPGVQKDDIKVTFDKGLLTVSFEKKQEQQSNEYKTLRREFAQNTFKRSFTLDEKINVEAIQAKYENGVLQFFLPKKEEVKVEPKQINIL